MPFIAAQILDVSSQIVQFSLYLIFIFIIFESLLSNGEIKYTYGEERTYGLETTFVK